jgi:single-strand DNA-binding protein
MSQGDLNQMILEGNLGHDPEVRYTASGQAVVNLRVACNRFYKDKENKQVKRTTWARCVVWGTRAEKVGEFLHSGSKVRIIGELCNGSFVNKDGVKINYDEIRVSDIRFLDRAPKGVQTEDQAPEDMPPPEDLVEGSSTPTTTKDVDVRNVTF